MSSVNRDIMEIFKMSSCESLKIRVAGNKKQVEEFTEKVREWSKQWGNRKIFRVKRYDRGHNLGKYHRTFGARRYVNYITIKLPRIPSNSQEEKA